MEGMLQQSRPKRMAWPSEERRFAPKCGRVGGGGRKNPFFFLFLVPEIPKIVRAQGPGRVDRAPCHRSRLSRKSVRTEMEGMLQQSAHFLWLMALLEHSSISVRTDLRLKRDLWQALLMGVQNMRS